jgi:K+-transporting ATPase c subunit
MKTTQQWTKSLKQWVFRSILSGIIFMLTVMGVGTVLIYAADWRE